MLMPKHRWLGVRARPSVQMHNLHHSLPWLLRLRFLRPLSRGTSQSWSFLRTQLVRQLRKPPEPLRTHWSSLQAGPWDTKSFKRLGWKKYLEASLVLLNPISTTLKDSNKGILAPYSICYAPCRSTHFNREIAFLCGVCWIPSLWWASFCSVSAVLWLDSLTKPLGCRKSQSAASHCMRSQNTQS